MQITRTALPIQQVATRFRETFRWQYVIGFAPLMPIFEVFRRITFSLPIALAESSSKVGLLAALAIGSILACLRMFLASESSRIRPLAAKVVRAMILGVLAFVGMAIVLAGHPTPLLAASLLYLSYALLGASIAILFVGWVQAYALDGSVMVLLYVSAAIFLGNLSQPYIISDESPWRMWAVLLACMGVSGLCLHMLRDKRSSAGPACGAADPGRAHAEGGDAAQGTTEDAPSRGTVSKLAVSAVRQAIRPALTTCAFGFALCFYAWGSTAIPTGAYLSNHSALVYFVGDGLAVAIVLVFVSFLWKSPNYRVAHQRAFFLLPIFAMFIGYFSFIRMLELGASGPLKDAIGIAHNMSLSGLWSLFIGTSAMQQHEKGLSAERCAAPAYAMGIAVFGLGLACNELLGNDAMYILVILSTVYVISLSLISARKASLNDEETTEQRCQALADKYGLSTREAEVLLLIALDYSMPRIAEQLSISIETERTHRKHIYAKMDVHGYEELARTIHRRKLP